MSYLRTRQTRKDKEDIHECNKFFMSLAKSLSKLGDCDIDTKWVFRTRQDGMKKARLAIRYFQHKETSQELFAPEAKMSTVISLALLISSYLPLNGK